MRKYKEEIRIVLKDLEHNKKLIVLKELMEEYDDAKTLEIDINYENILSFCSNYIKNYSDNSVAYSNKDMGITNARVWRELIKETRFIILKLQKRAQNLSVADLGYQNIESDALDMFSELLVGKEYAKLMLEELGLEFRENHKIGDKLYDIEFESSNQMYDHLIFYKGLSNLTQQDSLEAVKSLIFTILDNKDSLIKLY